jgi:hypothetical protein
LATDGSGSDSLPLSRAVHWSALSPISSGVNVSFLSKCPVAPVRVHRIVPSFRRRLKVDRLMLRIFSTCFIFKVIISSGTSVKAPVPQPLREAQFPVVEYLQRRWGTQETEPSARSVERAGIFIPVAWERNLVVNLFFIQYDQQSIVHSLEPYALSSNL